MQPSDFYNVFKSIQASHIDEGVKDMVSGIDKNTIRQEANKKLVSKQTLVQIGTIIIGLILAALVASGLNFDINRLTSPAYYIQVAINYIIMMSTYTTVRQMTISSEKRAENTPYSITVKQYWVFLQTIMANKLNDMLRIKIDEENKRRKEETIDFMLSQVSIDLKHEDIHFNNKKEFIEWLNAYTDKNLYSKKKKKQLQKVCEQALEGNFDYGQFTLEDLINDSEYKAVRIRVNTMQLATAKFETKQSLQKTFSFAFSALVLNSLVWNGFSMSFLTALLSNGFLLGSAAITAIDAGKKYINYRKEIITNRNTFLSTAIEIPTK